MTAWFDQLKTIINRHEEVADDHALARAAAVVLLEMAALDERADPRELETVQRAMAEAFNLDGAELEALISEADTLQGRAVSLHEYTRDLRTGLDTEAREELVGWLWRVAWADGRVDRYEEQLLRRLVDLLGVTHQAFIRLKHQAAPS